jgi:hypothetical protein
MFGSRISGDISHSEQQESSREEIKHEPSHEHTIDISLHAPEDFAEDHSQNTEGSVIESIPVPVSHRDREVLNIPSGAPSFFPQASALSSSPIQIDTPPAEEENFGPALRNTVRIPTATRYCGWLTIWSPRTVQVAAETDLNPLRQELVDAETAMDSRITLSHKGVFYLHLLNGFCIGAILIAVQAKNDHDGSSSENSAFNISTNVFIASIPFVTGLIAAGVHEIGRQANGMKKIITESWNQLTDQEQNTTPRPR